MDKIASNIAAIGVPTLVTKYMMGVSGKHGAPAFTTSMKAHGCGNMYRGVAVWGVIGLVTKSGLEFGMEKLATAVIRQRVREGEPKEILVKQVEKLPVSSQLKAKIEQEIKLTSRKDFTDGRKIF